MTKAAPATRNWRNRSGIVALLAAALSLAIASLAWACVSHGVGGAHHRVTVTKSTTSTNRYGEATNCTVGTGSCAVSADGDPATLFSTGTNGANADQGDYVQSQLDGLSNLATYGMRLSPSTSACTSSGSFSLSTPAGGAAGGTGPSFTTTWVVPASASAGSYSVCATDSSGGNAPVAGSLVAFDVI